MSKLFQWVKLSVENPKVVISIYLFLSAIVGVGGFDLYDKTQKLETQTIVVKDSTPIIIKQDNKCKECAKLRTDINTLKKRFNQTVRDFHGG